MEHLRNFLRLVLVNHVADLIDHNQLELSLHLSDCQFLIHAVTACEEELLGHSYIQKALCEALEPTFPVRFGGQEVSPPHVFGDTSSFVEFANDLRRHADSCTFYIFHSSTFYTVLHHTLQSFELLWP